MRTAIIGGTRYIGRAIVEHLAGAGHELLLVHRGAGDPADPPGLPEADHIHVDRYEIGSVAGDIAAWRPDAVIDTSCGSARGAQTALDALPDGVRLVVLSSVDATAAYGALQEGRTDEPVPLDERSPVRTNRFPYRGRIEGPWAEEYEKLDVEEAYLARGATVLRLPFVIGPRDYQRREEPFLRRVRAGRERIPIGSGSWLGSRVFVDDVAQAARLALEVDAAAGELFMLGEERTWAAGEWMRQVLRAARWDGELVRVPDDALPPDLQLVGEAAQHLLVWPGKAVDVLGWRPTDPAEATRRSVEWHLENPPPAPAEGDPGFDADDAALTRVTST